MKERYEIEYPFRMVYDEAWTPGCHDWHSENPVANGVGKLIITGAKLVKMPKGIMNRVVYVREFMDPGGDLTGRWVKTVTVGQFETVLAGYRRNYTVEEP